MLQVFRDNTQSIIVKIIIGFIIITFALFGVDSLIGLAGKPPAPIVVNGTDITEQELQNAVDLQRRQLISQMGENVDPSLLDDGLIRGAVVENLVEREVLRQAAVNDKMAVSDELIDRTILTTPEFQTDGSFDRNRFESVLRNVGMTKLSFRDYLRNEMLLGQDRTGFVASSFALPGELNTLTALDRQTRDIYLAEFPLGELTDVQISDAEIAERYEAEKANLQSEEQLALHYVELNKQRIAQSVEIDEEELQRQYDQLLGTFTADEARDAAHILIASGEDRSDAEAQTLIDEIADKLAQGEDFAELAQSYSEDPGSAEEGGYLGLVEKGIMVPEFEDALFAMEEGQVSAPVRTDYGYHLIKLNRIDVQEPPTFEQVRAQLENEQQLSAAENLFVERSEELDDLRFSTPDLQEVSDILGLKLQTTDFFGREGGDSALTQNPKVLQAAFSEEVLRMKENSGLIELDRDHIIVVNLAEYRPSRQLELEEVADQLRQQLAVEKRIEQRRQEVQALAESIQSADQLQGTDQWQIVSNVSRADARLAPEVQEKLFRLAPPEEGGVTTALIDQGTAGIALIAMTAVNDGADDLDPMQKQSLTAFYASHQGQLDYQGRVEHLKAVAEVERN